MAKKKNDPLIEAAADLLSACKAVIVFADQTGNCGVCGGDDDGHEDDCPMPAVRSAVDAAEAKS